MAPDHRSERALTKYELFVKVSSSSVLSFCSSSYIHMPECMMFCCTRLESLILQSFSIKCILVLNIINKFTNTQVLSTCEKASICC